MEKSLSADNFFPRIQKIHMRTNKHFPSSKKQFQSVSRQ